MSIIAFIKNAHLVGLFKLKKGKKPLLVSLLTSQFIMGILLGAIASYVVNISTEQYTYTQNKNRYFYMLDIELNSNRVIASNNAKNGQFFSHFETQVWDNGLANGYILSIDVPTWSKMSASYNQMKSVNHYIDDWLAFKSETDSSYLAETNTEQKELFKNMSKIYIDSRVSFINQLSSEVLSHIKDIQEN